MKNFLLKLFGLILWISILLPLGHVSAASNPADIDTSFDAWIPSRVTNGWLRSVAIQADGKILIWGQFSTYKWVASNQIARLNTDGSRDTSFNIGIGFDNQVYKIIPQADWKILMGGVFNTYKWAVVGRIIRLNSDGSRDNSFPDIPINFGLDNSSNVTSISIQSDGKIVVWWCYNSTADET
jgi:uncharacterized delta-60 repeat protein